MPGSRRLKPLPRSPPKPSIRSPSFAPSSSSRHRSPATWRSFNSTPDFLTGPALYDTLGMRLHNEQSGSSSLYTHPYAFEAVPLQDQQAPSAHDANRGHCQVEDRLQPTRREMYSSRGSTKPWLSLNQHETPGK